MHVDASAQQRPSAATCTALDMLIQNRDMANVRGCQRNAICTHIFCETFALGIGTTNATVAFSTCEGPFFVSVVLTTTATEQTFPGPITSTNTATRTSTGNSSIGLGNNRSLKLTVKQVNNGVTFGVSAI